MEVDRYEHGVPSWVDLGTPDIPKAIEFYSSLFGWQIEQGPPEAGGYSLAMLRGVFATGVAYLGIATGALGIVSEALRDIIGPGYLVYGLLLPSWFLAVGWRLYRLGRA